MSIRKSIYLPQGSTTAKLEPSFWHALTQIAWRKHLSLSALVRRVNADRREGSLASALRVYALDEAMRYFPEPEDWPYQQRRRSARRRAQKVADLKQAGEQPQGQPVVEPAVMSREA